MISVIIPTLNEQEQIANVVAFAKSQPNVSEVLVVDDQSLDQTVAFAEQAGAKVVSSTKLGKGASMKEGIMFAKNELVVFLDGDIHPYPHYTVKLLSDPLLQDEADFVKATFSRSAGRVTELVAKPLLSIFFPELTAFSQPLSGMIAGKKSLLQTLDFRDDYGVDIGILIDMHLNKYRVKEVEIGYIENNSKPWHALGKMSKEVAQTIITKAALSNNQHYNFEEFGVLQVIRSQMELALETHQKQFEKMVVFDMDNTLLRGRFIDTCAAEFGFKSELMELRSSEQDTIVLTKKIATLLKGRSIEEVIKIADNIPIVDDAKLIITELKSRGYLVGIISDSYDCVTRHIKNKLGMDFSLSNELEFSKGICTGEVKIPSFFFNQSNSICRHPLCKTNAVLSLCSKHQIQIKNTIAIGDSANDLCMVKEAGMGIAFCSSNELLNHHADEIIDEPTFQNLLEWV